MQPAIHTVYNSIRGGCGTVNAITTEQPMLNAHAKSSTINLNPFDLKSLCTHNNVLSR
ncbi:MAG: hypothetical protein VYE48_01180 [Pseudomonadota bacterium]|nr:hypothetical protein [Pseudomonadota bacterium]